MLQVSCTRGSEAAQHITEPLFYFTLGRVSIVLLTSFQITEHDRYCRGKKMGVHKQTNRRQSKQKLPTCVYLRVRISLSQNVGDSRTRVRQQHLVCERHQSIRQPPQSTIECRPCTTGTTMHPFLTYSSKEPLREHLGGHCPHRQPPPTLQTMDPRNYHTSS